MHLSPFHLVWVWTIGLGLQAQHSQNIPLPFSKSAISFPLVQYPLPQEESPLRGTEKEAFFGRLLPLDAPEQLWYLVDSELPLYVTAFRILGAEGIGLNWHGFFPKNGKLWVESNAELLAFHDPRWFPLHGEFAVRPLMGDQVNLWWIGASPPPLNLEAVAVPLWKSFAGYGDGGDCIPDAACPEAQGWEDPRKAVVMLLTANNTRFCTGTLINNTHQDGRPLLLTARHCQAQANSIYWFDYQSPSCQGPDKSDPKVLQGLVPLANKSSSDMALFELVQGPLPQWQVFFNGWSRDSLPPMETNGLHHPRGDVLKYCKDNDSPGRSFYVGPDENTGPYWRVNDWDIGSTEPGSSGSALFNSSQQIIGTLHGGFASCANDLEDYYGALHASWEGTDSSNRLKDWLDPMAIQAMDWPGAYHPLPVLAHDVGLQQVLADSMEICREGPIQVRCINYGSQLASGFDLAISSSAGNQLVTVNQYLASGDTMHLDLRPWVPSDTGWLGLELVISGAFENGVEEYPQDNTLKLWIHQVGGTKIHLRYQSDASPDEVSFVLQNRQGEPVYYWQTQAKDSLLESSVCVVPECYLWIATDKAGNGICCTQGEGFMDWSWGAQGERWEGFRAFGFKDTIGFCVPFPYAEPNLMALYPNPATSYFRFFYPAELLTNNIRLKAYDAMGRLVREWAPQGLIWTEIRPEGLAPGLYLLVLEDADFGILSKARLVWSSTFE